MKIFHGERSQVRQQFYMDHEWMRDFGENHVSYKPPINLKTVQPIMDKKPNGNKEIALNWITPHQKWGIHSTYSDNLLMLTLSRGGPIVWISEIDAKKADIEDNRLDRSILTLTVLLLPVRLYRNACRKV